MTKIKIIGIGDDGKQNLFPIYQRWIDESEVLVGGERQLAFFQDYLGQKKVIKGRLAALVADLKQEKRKTVVLASGDPLFYGIGSYLAKKLDVDIYPYVSSVQLAFASMNESWHDAYITSVHGREMSGLIQRINGKNKVAILTDQQNNPAEISRYLLKFGMTEYRVFIAENLGSADERSQYFTLEEAANQSFSSLNVMILQRTSEVKRWNIGIDDAEFHQRKPEKGLVTKKEVRTLSLMSLNLCETSVVWDIGTCTGSVAIEAALLAKEGQVFAIEKNQHDIDNCRLNQCKFRTDFPVLLGKAPEHLDQFGDPDAIFIGGTSGNMVEIVSVCCSRLKKNGRIVVNAVTIETLLQAVEAFQNNGFETTITLAQLSKSKPILQLTRFEALNPIYIITAKQKEGAIEW